MVRSGVAAGHAFPAADTKEAKALKGRSSSKGKGNAAARCTDGGAARDKGNEAFREALPDGGGLVRPRHRPAAEGDRAVDEQR